MRSNPSSQLQSPDLISFLSLLRSPCRRRPPPAPRVYSMRPTAGAVAAATHWIGGGGIFAAVSETAVLSPTSDDGRSGFRLDADWPEFLGWRYTRVAELRRQPRGGSRRLTQQCYGSGCRRDEDILRVMAEIMEERICAAIGRIRTRRPWTWSRRSRIRLASTAGAPTLQHHARRS